MYHSNKTSNVNHSFLAPVSKHRSPHQSHQLTNLAMSGAIKLLNSAGKEKIATTKNTWIYLNSNFLPAINHWNVLILISYLLNFAAEKWEAGMWDMCTLDFFSATFSPWVKAFRGKAWPIKTDFLLKFSEQKLKKTKHKKHVEHTVPLTIWRVNVSTSV